MCHLILSGRPDALDFHFNRVSSVTKAQNNKFKPKIC